MADVFISYARHDRERVETLAGALEKAGFSVWWDRDIGVGEAFSKTIEQELSAAGAVIVIWSEYGNDSEWVKDEASYARKLGKLFPIRFDRSDAPLGFQQFQTVDFSNWHGADDAPELQTLITSIKRRMEGAPAKETSTPRPEMTTAASKAKVSPMMLGGAAAAIIAIAIAVFLFARGGSEGTVTASNETPAAQSDKQGQQKIAEASLAVLPFINMSSDPEQEYFADGLSEELLNWLANVQGLKVPGRTSSFQYKDKLDDMRRIGEELGVRYLLEGSVRRSGDQLRITAQLIEADTGYHLWSETYDRKLADIFAIQEEIARIVVTELLGVLPESGFANPAAVGDVDPKAHEEYLAGRALWSARHPVEAIEHLGKAIEIDPNHALANAYFAIAAAAGIGNSMDFALTDPDLEGKMNAALERAVELQPNSADVIFAQGFVQELVYTPKNLAVPSKQVLDYYQRAVRANPRHVEALHALARGVKDKGEYVKLLEQVLAIDPGILSARLNLASAYASLGQENKAYSLLDQTFVILPDTWRAIVAETAFKANNLAKIGEYLFAPRPGYKDSGLDILVQAAFLADLGALEEAKTLLRANQDWADPDPYFYDSQFIKIALATLEGDIDTRLALLEESFSDSNSGSDIAFPLAIARIDAGKPQDALNLLEAYRNDAIKEYQIEGWALDSPGIRDDIGFAAAIALNDLGRAEEASTILENILTAGDPGNFIKFSDWEFSLNEALLQAQLGNRDEAIAAFRKAYDNGFRFLYSFNCGRRWRCINMGLVDPGGYFASLQGDPEFERVMADIRTDNARTLAALDRRYGVLAKYGTAPAGGGE